MAYTRGNLYFNYNGKSSKDYGLFIISTNSGMYEDILLPERTLTTIKPKGRTKSMLQNIEETDIAFTLEVGFEEGFTDKKIEEIAVWLKAPYFRPLYFEEYPNKVYDAMFVQSSGLIHDGLKNGYLSLNVQTNSPRVYSPYIVTNSYNVTSSTSIAINNKGHEAVYPELSLKSTDGNKVKIETLNKTTNAVESTFEISNLSVNEDLYIDCFRETIESGLGGTYHYEDTIGNFPSIKLGESIVKVTGKCTFQMRYKEIYLF